MSNDSAGSQLREIANLRDPRALYTESVAVSHFEKTTVCLQTTERPVYSERVRFCQGIET